MARTKQTHKTAQKHAERQDVTGTQNKLFLCVLVFSVFELLILKMN